MLASMRSNVDDLKAAMIARARQLMPAVRQGTRKATIEFREDSVRRMGRGIYDRGIPLMIRGETRATGGRKRARKHPPAWVRTGNLRGSERMRVVSAVEGQVRNDADYAAARHDMPDIKTRGGGQFTWRHGDRTAHWRQDTIDAWKRDGRLSRIYNEAIMGLLKRTAVG